MKSGLSRVNGHGAADQTQTILEGLCEKSLIFLTQMRIDRRRKVSECKRDTIVRAKKSAAKLNTRAENTAPKQSLRFQPRKYPLSVTPRPTTGRKTLYDLAIDVIAPWRFKDYPGRERAWVQIAAQLPFVLKDTRNGKRAYDIATLERLISAVEARAQFAVSTLESLKAERDRLVTSPSKRQGFCVVDSVTGHDGRYRGSKRRRKAA